MHNICRRMRKGIIRSMMPFPNASVSTQPFVPLRAMPSTNCFCRQQ